MNIVIKQLSIKNFKGIKDLSIQFGKRTSISGENATGKTTVFDAVTWLLFNKNSLGSEKFDIRPLDADGKTVDFVEINVTAEFENADTGENFTLDKTQKQKWTKHTGEDTATFTGNVNEYGVNGFPKSEKEYKAFIANIIDEEHFKLLSSPTYFTSLPWKKQREILMSLVSEESDLDFAKRVGGFDILIPELEVAPKTSDIMEKWKRTKKELDTQHKEYPIRIDELSRNKVDYDLPALKTEKAKLEVMIETANAKKDDTALKEAQNELAELELAKKAMQSKADEQLQASNKAYFDEQANLKRGEFECASVLMRTDKEIKDLDYTIERCDKELSDLGAEYHKVHGIAFDESSENCPVCKRRLPEEEVASIKAKWSADKSNKEKELIDKGNEIKLKGNKAKDEYKELVEKRKAYEEEHKRVVDALVRIEERIRTMKTTADLSGEKDYQYLVSEIEKARAKVESLQAEKPVEIDATELSIQLRMVNTKIAEAEANATIEKRIKDLMAEQRVTSQKIADAEKVINALEKFIKAKLESVCANINGKFEMMNFKLFNVLLNGGVEECCEATFNGVPYSSLNNGMKICGGLDIISTLSKEFGKSVFVFVDNAESVNDYRLPSVAGQLVTLSVTDSKELKVEDK